MLKFEKPSGDLLALVWATLTDIQIRIKGGEFEINGRIVLE